MLSTEPITQNFFQYSVYCSFAWHSWHWTFFYKTLSYFFLWHLLCKIIASKYSLFNRICFSHAVSTCCLWLIMVWNTHILYIPALIIWKLCGLAFFSKLASYFAMPRDTIRGMLCIIYAHIICQVGRRTKYRFVKSLSFHMGGVIYAQLPLLIVGR